MQPRRSAALVCFWLLSDACARAAAPHYFITREAGTYPSISNPIALKQPPNANQIAYDYAGNLYYGLGEQILRLNPDGTDTPVAGSRSTSARFVEGEPAIDAPLAIYAFKFDKAGNLYIADGNAEVVYKVTTDGMIHTFAGTGVLAPSLVPATGPSVPARAVPLSIFSLEVDPSGTVYVQSDVNSGEKPSAPAICSAILSFPPDGAALT